MVWDAAEPHGGFTTGTPWLPVKPPQLAQYAAGQLGRPDSVLEFYRRMLALRRETGALRTGASAFFDVAEPVLAFTRGGSVLCVFNLSPLRCEVVVTGAGPAMIGEAAERRGERLALGPNGFAIMPVEGAAMVADIGGTGREAPALP
jgi:alpha-glucosidase